MDDMNGIQLYGWGRWLVLLRMMFNRELRGVSLMKKLALNSLFRTSKLTRMDNKIYLNTLIPYYPSHAYNRFLKGVKAVCSGYPIPIVTNVAVTTAFQHPTPDHSLDYATIEGIIEDAQELGTSVIGITGGEPLLRNDLEDIIAAVDERSMPILFTTGLGLTVERVASLKQAGLEIPIITLNHYRPQEHDSRSKKKGAFDIALRAIRLFREQGFFVAVSSAPNIEMVKSPEDLQRIVRFFKDLGVNDMRLARALAWDGLSENIQDASVTKEDIQTIYNLQKKCIRTPGYPGAFAHDFFESDAFLGCGAGYNHMYVDASGNVCPCDRARLSFGNVHHRPLKEIWHETSRAFPFPGCVCYADKCHDLLKEFNIESLPVKGDDAWYIIQRCPTHDPEKPPRFFRRMGLHLQQKRIMSDRVLEE